MELKQLQYFLAVAEHLNFSRAAEALYISQPALSYQIAELERELGTELFLRDRRKVYLTTAGAGLIKPAQEALEASNRLLQLAQNKFPVQEETAAELRIGFDSTEDHFEATGVTEQIARLGLACPELQLEMTRAPFPECADQVIYGDMDVAFLILRHKEHLPPDLTCKTVYRSRIVMVVRADCPAQTCMEAVESQELILVGEKPRGNSRILKVLENMKLDPNIRRVDSMPAGFTYAQMGKGIMLLSEIYFQQHRYPGLKAIQIPDEAAVITHVAVWNRNNRNPMVQKLLDRFD
ncbi:MAG: LysR family transcriptional regulator [Oscillospiraceae bacterium]|nr:LysR family transcriptional regulator [Oscillospiraceae bacterium]